MHGTRTCQREAQWSEGPRTKHTRFVEEEADGHRGPATDRSGTGAFAFLFPPRAGPPTTVPLALSDRLSAAPGCAAEGALPVSLDAGQTPGIGEGPESLG